MKKANYRNINFFAFILMLSLGTYCTPPPSRYKIPSKNQPEVQEESPQAQNETPETIKDLKIALKNYFFEVILNPSIEANPQLSLETLKSLYQLGPDLPTQCEGILVFVAEDFGITHLDKPVDWIAIKAGASKKEIYDYIISAM